MHGRRTIICRHLRRMLEDHHFIAQASWAFHFHLDPLESTCTPIFE